MQGTSADNNGGKGMMVDAVTCVNLPNKVYFRWVHESVLRNHAGALTGTAGAGTLPDMDILPPSCTQGDEFSVNSAVPGAVCPPDVDFTT